MFVMKSHTHTRQTIVKSIQKKNAASGMWDMVAMKCGVMIITTVSGIIIAQSVTN
jgi:hypothetical protein